MRSLFGGPIGDSAVKKLDDRDFAVRLEATLKLLEIDDPITDVVVRVDDKDSIHLLRSAALSRLACTATRLFNPSRLARSARYLTMSGSISAA